MRRRLAAWARLSIGVGVLAFLVARLGAAPFLDALDSLRGPAVALGLSITALTTLCSVWRWRLVAEGLGVPVPLPAAVAQYYQSQLLDATLPGGVVGDVHRGVRHGRGAGSVGRGLRAVVWERSLGQGVQLSLAVVVLVLLPSPAPAVVPLVAALALVTVAAGALVLLTRRAQRPGAVARAISTVRNDLRDIVRTAPGSLTRIVLASTVVVAGHAAMFMVAARTVGVPLSVDRLLPVGMVVLVASAVPASFAGWGPREGAAAWAFGAAGLSTAQGLSTAVVYGVMTLVASLPGAIVLFAGRPQHRPPHDRQDDASCRPEVSCA